MTLQECSNLTATIQEFLYRLASVFIVHSFSKPLSLCVIHFYLMCVGGSKKPSKRDNLVNYQSAIIASYVWLISYASLPRNLDIHNPYTSMSRECVCRLRMHMCMYLCIYMHMYPIATYIATYVCTDVCMYMHTYVCSYIHTYVHTYITVMHNC